MGRVLPDVEDAYFARHGQQRRLVVPFLDLFDVTFGRDEQPHNSSLPYFFLRPSHPAASELYGFDRHVLLAYSPYEDFERGRVKHIVDIFSLPHAKDRLETHCFLLISRDEEIVDKIATYNSQSPQGPFGVAFTETEIGANLGNPWYIRSRLSQVLYARDPFDVQLPLKAESQFFGRGVFVQELRDRFLRGENTGLFGLRRTGKTSVLLKLGRDIEAARQGAFVYIDAEDPSVYTQRWWGALVRIGNLVRQRFALGDTPADPDTLGPNSSMWLRSTLQEAFARHPDVPRLLVAIDEIENLLPGTSAAAHWQEDFLPMWRAIRSIQVDNRRLGLVVSGVNGRVFEQSQVGRYDNPLLGFMAERYLPPFAEAEVRQMVRKLGRYIGLHFSEEAYRYLSRNYGGFPLLIRMACSWHHQKAVQQGLQRPFEISVSDMEGVRADRDASVGSLAEHILNVLRRWYEFEYEALVLLAQGHTTDFSDIEQSARGEVGHLRKYGLVVDGDEGPTITVRAIREYLAGSGGAQRSEEKASWIEEAADIGRMRNRLEPRLRAFVKQNLLARYGARWVDHLTPHMKTKPHMGQTQEEILGSLYLSDIVKVMTTEWECFKGLESLPPSARLSKKQLGVLIDYINAHRADAHARVPAKNELATIAVVCDAVENALDHLGVL